VPGFDGLWNDCIQEKTQLDSRDGLKSSNDDNLALASQARKDNFRKFVCGESTAQDGKKKDVSKVKCFACHKFGHYAGQCPHRKKGGGMKHN
jgi:hypothetical protein